MTTAHDPTANDLPFRGRFHHSRGELIADGVVHIVGLTMAVVAGAVLLALGFSATGPWEYAAAVLFVVSLVAVLTISLIYNQWPVGRVKWVLRRFDHAAIYLLIAATYTPFLVQLGTEALPVLAVVWAAAGAGIALKLFLPGRLDGLAIAFYLAIGWSGVVLARPLIETLTPTTITLLVAGGLVYSLGVIVYVLQQMRFQNAIWHGFVVMAAGLHCAAVMDCLVLARL